jgi:hypothetical protein
MRMIELSKDLRRLPRPRRSRSHGRPLPLIGSRSLDDARNPDSETVYGELRQRQAPGRPTYRFRLMLLSAGILCPTCGHPWALKQKIMWAGTKYWIAYCPVGHADADCRCRHSRMRVTMRGLGVPVVRRCLVALTYYVLRAWRE